MFKIRFISTLFNRPHLGYKDERIYRMASIFILTAMFVLSALGIYALVEETMLSFWVTIVAIAIFGILLFQHTKEVYFWPGYVCFLVAICITVYGSLYHGADTGFHYLLIVYAFTPVLFFTKRWQFFSLFALSVASYIVVNILFEYTKPVHVLRLAVVLYYLNVFVAIFSIYFSFSYFKGEQLKHVGLLKLRNLKIEKQKESLTIIKKQLEVLLTEKERRLNKQNDDIVQYAFLNSHKARGPVARILGLINLSNYEDFADVETRKYFFDKLSENVEELDDILKEISSILNSQMEEKS